MWGYREDLIARLNHVLAQLDWGSRPLGQNKPVIGEDTVYRMGKYHMKLRDALRGAGVETIELWLVCFSNSMTVLSTYTNSRVRV